MDRYAFDDFIVDPVKRTLQRQGVLVKLAPKIFDVLLYLVENPERVIDKDELFAAAWPGRVVEEGSLTQSIFSLRKVLGKREPGGSHWVVTAPGRGYRFAARVSRIPERPIDELPARQPASLPAASPATGAEATIMPGATAVAPALPESAAGQQRDRGRRHWVPRLSGATVLLLAIAISTVAWFGRPRPAERRLVVLSRFENQSQDPDFDNILGRVLEIGLSQSPYLSIVSRDRIARTLTLMQVPHEAALTPDLALQVCARLGGRAMLTGTLASAGGRYWVTLQARDCADSSVIADELAQAQRREEVPARLDELSARLRVRLDESIQSVRGFEVPIAQATTPSFEALKAYSAGLEVRAHGDNATAIRLFRRAVEIDPAFALAYSQLGSAYFGMREEAQANRNFRKAYELRDRTTEYEKLAIAAFYQIHFGSYAESVGTLEVWAKTYPLDWRPWANLANYLTRMGQYPQALEAGRTALRLNPDNYGSTTVLARALKRTNRFDEAKQVCKDASARGLDNWDIHGLLYEIAFTQGDTAAMAAAVALEGGKPTEPWMLDYQAHAAAFEGRLRDSRRLYEQAIGLARTLDPGDHELADTLLGEYIQTLGNLGLNAEARKLAEGEPRLAEDGDNEFMFASIGSFDQALRLARAQLEKNPNAAAVTELSVPATKAAVYLGQHRAVEAIEAMGRARPFELQDFSAPDLLGRAYLQTGDAASAAVEFRKILDHRGVDGNSELYALAYLGLARALRIQGRVPESRASYEQLFKVWAKADADLPPLVEARREYASLR